ncbi:MAG: leucine-rich repeat domain-containing protein, partial [bacterium]
LTSMELPEGLEEIGEEAFRGCESLHAIIIPPFVKKIPAKAFYSCSQLTSMELPEGLEEIGEEAFRGCESLHAIIIPPFVKKIPAKAFYSCSQ